MSEEEIEINKIFGKCVHNSNLASCQECELTFKKLESGVTVETLFFLAHYYGGKIVSSAHSDLMEIQQAKASGRFLVGADGSAFLWDPEIKDFPTNDTELEFFEKWYPLQLRVPKNLRSTNFLHKKKKKK